MEAKTLHHDPWSVMLDCKREADRQVPCNARLSPSNMMRPFALALASTSGLSKGIARYCRMAPAVDSGVYGLFPLGTPFAAAMAR